MTWGDGYALDRVSPVRHVAVELDRAAPAALSVRQLATTYDPLSGDVFRVREHESIGDDLVAKEWIIGHAIDELGDQLKRDDQDVMLAISFDDLRYKGKQLQRIVESDERNRQQELRGAVSKARQSQDPSARGLRPLDQNHLQRLRESIEEFGKHDVLFPVLISEKDGSILDGRHRLAIDPNWARKSVRGLDDEEAVRITLVGNIAKQWSRKHWDALADQRDAVGQVTSKRDQIKVALIEFPELSHRKIAEKLGDVSASTVDRTCKDEVRHLTHFSCTHGKSGQGARSDLKDQKPQSQLREERVEQTVLLLTQGRNEPQIAELLGVSASTANSYAREAKARIAAQQESEQAAEKAKNDEPEPTVTGDVDDGPRQTEHVHRWVCAECDIAAPSDS